MAPSGANNTGFHAEISTIHCAWYIQGVYSLKNPKTKSGYLQLHLLVHHTICLHMPGPGLCWGALESDRPLVQCPIKIYPTPWLVQPLSTFDTNVLETVSKSSIHGVSRIEIALLRNLAIFMFTYCCSSIERT